MILSKQFCRRPSRFSVLAFLLLGLLAILVVQVHEANWAGGARLFCLFYAGVITVFFIAQIVAFVVGHANYCETVEQPKYDLIINEEKEWQGFHAPQTY